MTTGICYIYPKLQASFNIEQYLLDLLGSPRGMIRYTLFVIPVTLMLTFLIPALKYRHLNIDSDVRAKIIGEDKKFYVTVFAMLVSLPPALVAVAEFHAARRVGVHEKLMTAIEKITAVPEVKGDYGITDYRLLMAHSMGRVGGLVSLRAAVDDTSREERVEARIGAKEILEAWLRGPRLESNLIKDPFDRMATKDRLNSFAELPSLDTTQPDLNIALRTLLELRSPGGDTVNLQHIRLVKPSISGGVGGDRRELRSINWSHSWLYGADFANTDLQGSKFSRSYLFHADMSNSDLTGVDFAGATLAGVNLAGTKSSSASDSPNFSNATCICVYGPDWIRKQIDPARQSAVFLPEDSPQSSNQAWGKIEDCLRKNAHLLDPSPAPSPSPTPYPSPSMSPSSSLTPSQSATPTISPSATPNGMPPPPAMSMTSTPTPSPTPYRILGDSGPATIPYHLVSEVEKNEVVGFFRLRLNVDPNCSHSDLIYEPSEALVALPAGNPEVSHTFKFSAKVGNMNPAGGNEIWCEPAVEIVAEFEQKAGVFVVLEEGLGRQMQWKFGEEKSPPSVRYGKRHTNFGGEFKWTWHASGQTFMKPRATAQ